MSFVRICDEHSSNVKVFFKMFLNNVKIEVFKEKEKFKDRVGNLKAGKQEAVVLTEKNQIADFFFFFDEKK